jgi:hypothetical protein
MRGADMMHWVWRIIVVASSLLATLTLAVLLYTLSLRETFFAWDGVIGSHALVMIIYKGQFTLHGMYGYPDKASFEKGREENHEYVMQLEEDRDGRIDIAAFREELWWCEDGFEAGLAYPVTRTYPGSPVFVCKMHDVSFPLWSALLLFSACPFFALIRGPYRRYRRRKKGLCLECGYNLTGNTSGVCPECGTKL